MYKDKDLRKTLIEECKKQNIDFNSEEGKNVVASSLAIIITAIQGREVDMD